MAPKKKNLPKPHWRLEDGLIVFDESTKVPAEPPQLPNYGAPISKGVARKIIKNYWEKRSSSKAPYAFSFGKKSLNLILNQVGCQGIRFYFAEKTETDLKYRKKDLDKWDIGITLVAIGLKREPKQNDRVGDEPEIGVKGKYLIEDLKLVDNETDKDEIQLGVFLETDPPLPRPAPGPKNNKFKNNLNEFYEAY